MTKFKYFTYKNKELYCENTPLTKIAKDYKTPCYVYSYRALQDAYHEFDKAFDNQKHIVCYSIKANANQAILKSLFNKGCGADIVSGGELERALMAGADPAKIVYSGVGKTKEEIELALNNNILLFNIESDQELLLAQEIAKEKNKQLPLSIRVNPDVNAETHAYISTGMKKNKFGVSHKRAHELYEKAKKLSHLNPIGISCHIGSQITKTKPFYDAMLKLKEVINDVMNMGIKIDYIDVGGGLGIVYKDETIPTAKEYAKSILDPLKEFNATIITEPGRYIVGNAGIFLAKVLYTKQGETGEHFTIVDGAFNDLMRPMLYDAYHEILPLNEAGSELIKTNIEGPICETSDRFTKQRKLPKLNQNDLIAFMSAGAYGMSMSSNYNSRPRVCEILVKDTEFFEIKKRDSIKDITKNESIPLFLK